MQVVEQHSPKVRTPTGSDPKNDRPKINPQLLCERLLALDSKILYSSYVNSSDSRVGEAIRSQIGLQVKLTIMVLPVNRGKDSLILAAPIRSDLTEIVAKAKRFVF
ncbi:MAG: hypothetical protein ACHQ1H_14080 [Nitrososphaerales archaeon]